MVVSEFEKVLREAAASRRTDRTKRPNRGGSAAGLCFNNWLGSSSEEAHALGHGVPDTFLQEYQSFNRDGPCKDQPLTLEDLKARIRAGLTKEEASALRRQFAIHAHPDHCDEAGREAATDLMARANDLLDQVASKQSIRP